MVVVDLRPWRLFSGGGESCGGGDFRRESFILPPRGIFLATKVAYQQDVGTANITAVL